MAIIVINPYQYAAPIGPSADPYSDYVSLLLHGNGTNNSTTVTDSSGYNHAVTPVADAKISTTQNKFGGASIYLDGSGDCLSLPDDQSAFNFGTGDFTIECWIYWVGGSYGTIFSQRHDLTTENTGISWRIDDSNDVILFFHGKASEGSDYFYTQDDVISKNTWTHIALTRNGNTFTIWVNGQSEATNTSTISMIYHAPIIGRTLGRASEYLNAYLDDFRITKGVARYTSNFTPPTAELPDPSDPDFSDVSLLLHGDGTNGSTAFRDSSNNSHAITPVGNAQISTTQSKSGGASMYFDGSGDYLSVPNDTSFDLGSGNFTFEFWTYLNSTTAPFINKQVPGITGPQYLYFYLSGGSLRLWATSNKSTWDISENFAFGNTALSTGQWYHIALVRNGTEIATYVNGIKSPNTITTSAAINNANTIPLIIGADTLYNAYQNAYMDDLRITKGVARYTANFTPPTAPLPNPVDPDFSSVSLLLHGNGANNSTTFTDSSSNAHTVTANGDAEISTTQSKFGGASMYFDGSGDYLTATDSSFAFGTGEFTIEFWMRAASIANSEASLSVGNAGTSNSWQISPVSSGTDLGFVGASSVIVSTSFPSLNTWHHVAVVRDSSNVVTLYLNGTNVDSATNTNNYSATNLRVGVNRAVTAYYDGYIDDLRITKGVARYTSSFTPQTAPFPND